MAYIFRQDYENVLSWRQGRELGLILSGATLMRVGIFPEYPERDFGTVTYHIEEK